MSENKSEVDEITRDASRLTLQIAHLIRAWRTMNPTATKVPRSVRREINHAIKADAKDQQFAHAQERVRMQRAVMEYRWKLVQDRSIRSWDTQQSWFERQRDLAVAHDRLRTSIYNTAHLTATERGQINQAIDGIHRNPETPSTLVFGKTSGLAALRTKLADGITRLRAGLAGPAEQRRLQQWSDLHAERVAHAEQARQRPDWVLTPDPKQPIPFVPTDYPGLHRDPVSGIPRPITLRNLTKRIDRYSELRFGPDEDKTTPEDIAAYDRRASEYRDVLIADAHMLGADQAELVATALNNIDLAYSIRREGQELLLEQGIESMHPQHAADRAAEQAELGRTARNLYYNRGYSWSEVADTLGIHREQLVDILAAAEPATPADRSEQAVAEPERPSAYRTDDHSAPHQGTAARPAAPADISPDPGYEIIIGTTESMRTRPDLLDRGNTTTVSEGYRWALDQLYGDNYRQSSKKELTVHIRRPGQTAPAYSFVGSREDIADEIHNALEHDPGSPSEIADLRAALKTTGGGTSSNPYESKNTSTDRPERSRSEFRSATVEHDRADAAGADTAKTSTVTRTPTQAEVNQGYEVVIGTTEFVTKHPELVDRGIVTTLSDGYRWAKAQLDNDRHGWPADADLTVAIHRPGQADPVYSATGPRGMVTDEITTARAEHNRTPLAEVEQLRTELRAAHTENEQLRTENTDLVRKFAEHDLTPDRSAAIPTMPQQGPKLARPIFTGPVITRPVMNGMDR